MATFLKFIVLFNLLNLVFGGTFINFSYGGRNNKLWVPGSPKNPAPLYVMLHGCTQNPDDFARGTTMNDVAEARGAYVLYPEQPSSVNTNKCWNWFQPSDQSRGSGEPKLISDMTKEVQNKYNIDKARTYVAGLSAGAAMSVIMGATYPDVYSAIGVGAGLEYKAANSVTSAYTAMSSGGPDPTTQGRAANDAAKNIGGTIGVYVVHGTSDYTVYPVNGDQVTKQWITTLNLRGTTISTTPTESQQKQVPGGYSYIENTYVDTRTGNAMVKYIIVDKMGHAWSGGSNQGSFADPKGPNASILMADFFSNFPPSNVSTTASSSTSGSTTSSTSGSTTGGDSVPTFYAIPSETGFVSIINGYGVDSLKIGDDGLYTLPVFKTILSFDTSDLPTNCTILSAKLGIYGKNQIGEMKSIPVDIKDGPFGNTNSLEPSDYYSKPSVSNFANLPVPGDGQYVELSLPSSVYPYISRAGINGRTQFRLEGVTGVIKTVPSTNQLYFESPNNTNLAPRLIVDYK